MVTQHNNYLLYENLLSEKSHWPRLTDILLLLHIPSLYRIGARCDLGQEKIKTNH